MAHIPFLSHYLERKNIEYQNQLLARQVEEEYLSDNARLAS